MRTVFVNPARPRKARKSGSALARSGQNKPRRKNAGIAPFMAQPLVLPNPTRRKVRRKNPSLNLQKTFQLALVTAGGAGLAAAGDTFVAQKIENVWARNGARAAMGVAASAFLPKEMGAAAAGAMFFPVAQELLGYFLSGQPASPAAQAAEEAAETEADLDLLAADLDMLAGERALREW